MSGGATYWHQTPQVNEKPIHEYVHGGRNTGYSVQCYCPNCFSPKTAFGIHKGGKQVGKAKTLREAKTCVERLVEAGK